LQLRYRIEYNKLTNYIESESGAKIYKAIRNAENITIDMFRFT